MHSRRTTCFKSWLAASEVHRREYQQYHQLWYNFDYQEPKPKRVARRKGRTGIALLLVAGLVAGAVQWYAARGATYATALGEHRPHAEQYGGLECRQQNPGGAEQACAADHDALQFE